jgi:hypothetical protein
VNSKFISMRLFYRRNSSNIKIFCKNMAFFSFHKIFSPFWETKINNDSRKTGIYDSSLSVSILIMHKDVGNISRNLNFEELKKFAHLTGYKFIQSEATYFSDIVEGIKHIKEKFELNVVPKVETNSSGRNVEFPYAPGSLGIYATFVNGLKRFEELDSDYLLIFEDDLQILERFKNVLTYVLSRNKKEWDVINLFSDPSAHKPLKSIMLELFKPLIQNYSTSISACYLLNRSSVSKILKDLEINGVRTNLDWYLFNGFFLSIGNQPRFKALQVNPFFPKFSQLIPDYKTSTILLHE